MNIELIVQDCFFEASQSATPEANSLTNPISTSTWEHWFSQWLETLHPDNPPAPTHELTLRLTDDAEIQALNSQFRHKNQPTDVLSFAALEVDSPQIPPDMQAAESVYLGDLVISVETAYRQAQHQGHPLSIELAWLATHGLLHLLGWDHPDEESLQRMLNQQQALLQIVNLTLPV
ncbi:MAG: rRNA maturation RNase YbeY [Coleofasciculus sp. A1-SPW-01]|uniref:rRNA maturation RNase YbeY n=1 Tax=Coleofasciculus TaxID=669368 RepID=UPI0005C5D5B0|nr:rRNA maturation RNase YbeY [Coleofasciculus chthonoplastes]